MSGRGAPRPPSRRAGRLRPWLLAAHRLVGLAITAFVIVAGATGSVLVFQHELEAVVCPSLHRAPSSDAVAPLDPASLAETVEGQLAPGARLSQVPLRVEPGATAALYVTPATPAADDQVFADPATGRIVGSRHWEAPPDDRCHLIPFLFRLHYALALGDVGTWLMGVVALLWTVDCFVGAYLTFPTGATAPPSPRRRSWLARWLPAWGLRTGRLAALVFTWHRASGLWLWGLLFVFAWSGVGLNLRPVYEPVMDALFTLEPSYDERASPPPERPGPTERPSWRAGLTAAREHMADEAARRGFTILAERRIAHDAALGAFRYQVQSSLDVSDRYPATTVWVDEATGRLLAFEPPTGRAAGNTITSWLYHLHFGTVAGGGLPYRVLVSAAGLGVVLLAMSGVWLWLRGRARRARSTGAPASGPARSVARRSRPGALPRRGNLG